MLASSGTQAAQGKTPPCVVSQGVGPWPNAMELSHAQHRRVPRARLAVKAQEFQCCYMLPPKVNSRQFSCMTMHARLMHFLTMSSVTEAHRLHHHSCVAHWYLKYHSSNYGCLICCNNRSGSSCSCIPFELMHLRWLPILELLRTGLVQTYCQ